MSESMQGLGRELEELVRVLDAFGPDPERWPEADRTRLADLVRSDATAKRLATEARLLDRLLDLAQGAADRSGHDALLERICAEAASEPGPGRITGPASEPAAGRIISFPKRPPRPYASSWQIAGLMAASLALGMLAGANGVLDRMLGPAVPGAAAIDEAGDEAQIALGGDAGDLLEEDVW